MALGIRCRRHTCKIVLITSLLWCFLDLLVLMTYSDCSNGIGWACGGGSGAGGSEGGKRGALKFARQVQDDPLSIYPRSALRSWELAPVVHKQRGHVGEMGTAVVVPADREDEKKEKFKINQFNLVASEMISLNRSLKDVRLSA